MDIDWCLMFLGFIIGGFGGLVVTTIFEVYKRRRNG